MKLVDCVCGQKPHLFSEPGTDHEIFYVACSSDFECLANTPDMPNRTAAAKVWNAMQEAAGKETR